MRINSEQEMLDFGESFAKNIHSKNTIVIELIGDVGAGKTTFVRGFAKGLNIKKSVTSPSFTISKAYALPNNKGHLIHYDFYRLSEPGLMINDLTENITNPQNIIIVEWGSSIKDFLPKNRFILNFKKNNDNSREIYTENHQNDTDEDVSKISKKSIQKQSSRPNTPTKDNTKLSLFLDTSTQKTILKLNNQEYHHDFANDLAEKLLKFIQDKLSENNKTWQDITEITFMSGPGSFTGLRIGATIVNTLARELNIPLYDHHGNKHQIIIPDYGRPANISKPRK